MHRWRAGKAGAPQGSELRSPAVGGEQYTVSRWHAAAQGLPPRPAAAAPQGWGRQPRTARLEACPACPGGVSAAVPALRSSRSGQPRSPRPRRSPRLTPRPPSPCRAAARRQGAGCARAPPRRHRARPSPAQPGPAPAPAPPGAAPAPRPDRTARTKPQPAERRHPAGRAHLSRGAGGARR